MVEGQPGGVGDRRQTEQVGLGAVEDDDLVAGGDVKEIFAVTPDSTRVIYLADADTNHQTELFSDLAGIRCFGQWATVIGTDGDDQLEGTAGQCSDLERQAMDVERKIDALYCAWFMKDRVGEEFEATVSGCAEFAVFARLDDPERYQTVFAREPGSAAAPTAAPTQEPTGAPTAAPSEAPSAAPTNKPLAA